jgi:hypothetical protein
MDCVCGTWFLEGNKCKKRCRKGGYLTAQACIDDNPPPPPPDSPVYVPRYFYEGNVDNPPSTETNANYCRRIWVLSNSDLAQIEFDTKVNYSFLDRNGVQRNFTKFYGNGSGCQLGNDYIAPGVAVGYATIVYQTSYRQNEYFSAGSGYYRCWESYTVSTSVISGRATEPSGQDLSSCTINDPNGEYPPQPPDYVAYEEVSATTGNYTGQPFTMRVAVGNVGYDVTAGSIEVITPPVEVEPQIDDISEGEKPDDPPPPNPEPPPTSEDADQNKIKFYIYDGVKEAKIDEFLREEEYNALQNFAEKKKVYSTIKVGDDEQEFCQIRTFKNKGNKTVFQHGDLIDTNEDNLEAPIAHDYKKNPNDELNPHYQILSNPWTNILKADHENFEYEVATIDPLQPIEEVPLEEQILVKDCKNVELKIKRLFVENGQAKVTEKETKKIKIKKLPLPPNVDLNKVRIEAVSYFVKV